MRLLDRLLWNLSNLRIDDKIPTSICSSASRLLHIRHSAPHRMLACSLHCRSLQHNPALPVATTCQAAPAATAAVIGSGTTSTTSQTIVGSHVFRIEGFSATKDLGVGKCIKSSTFSVGGHVWYIDCYPCGVHEGRAGSVYLKLCRQEDHPGSSRVSGDCKFTLMKSLKDGSLEILPGGSSKSVTFDDRHSLPVTDFIKRGKLESLLMYDRFVVRCVVLINKFPAVPQSDLATETDVGSHSHVLTVDGYSKTRAVLAIGEGIQSSLFRVGGHCWWFEFYPCGKDKNKDDGRVTVVLMHYGPGDEDDVTVRFEVTLLTHAGQIISSTQDFSTFSPINYKYVCNFLIMMEHESWPLLQDGIQIRCDIAVVNGITATPNLRQGIRGDLQGRQHVRGDVTFEVGGRLFAAHKCVLATRCTAFMAEFFGPSRKENADVTDHVRVDGMETRVFEALLHFIYTDALPEVHEDDKVVMAQSLLVAADRYSMKRLKLICGDLLCSYINDARTAVTTLDLADKHGCRRLKEACMKFLMDQFA